MRTTGLQPEGFDKGSFCTYLQSNSKDAETLAVDRNQKFRQLRLGDQKMWYYLVPIATNGL